MSKSNKSNFLNFVFFYLFSESSVFKWNNIHSTHLDTSDHSNLLSKRENEMLEIRNLEAAEQKSRTKQNGDQNPSSNQIGFKFDASAMDAIDEFVNQAKGNCCSQSIPCNFCILTLDLETEVISAKGFSDFDVNRVPKTHATYCLRNFQENIVFALCIPNENDVTARELMMYATGKAGVISTLEACGVKITDLKTNKFL